MTMEHEECDRCDGEPEHLAECDSHDCPYYGYLVCGEHHVCPEGSSEDQPPPNGQP